MSHTVVGVFAWHGETRLPVVVAGRILGACSTDTYPTIVTAARAREVVLGLGCDGRGVAANALSVVEVVRHGDEVIVRTGALRRPRARITAVHEMGRIALGGASNVRAASAAETQVARDTITNWYGSP